MGVSIMDHTLWWPDIERQIKGIQGVQVTIHQKIASVTSHFPPWNASIAMLILSTDEDLLQYRVWGHHRLNDCYQNLSFPSSIPKAASSYRFAQSRWWCYVSIDDATSTMWWLHEHPPSPSGGLLCRRYAARSECAHPQTSLLQPLTPPWQPPILSNFNNPSSAKHK